jgi:hypothetical protein
MWVDGVGGFLVCLRDSVVIGQANVEPPIDIPIRADLSRRHVQIRRQNEAYWVEPFAALKMEGRPIQSPQLLRDGDELQLGTSVQLRFRQPHPLSATARIEMLSHHRIGAGYNGVLLMSESCVLGPKWQNHVVCRDWSQELVLVKQGGQLACRSMQSFELDGQLCDGRGPLTFSSRISGDDFCVSLEPIV